jgi:hypothetical protein
MLVNKAGDTWLIKETDLELVRERKPSRPRKRELVE